MHDAPYRRNRDFKPVAYGSFKGFPNYKHSETFCLLKNLKDLSNEEHQFPIKYSKLALKGGFVGAILGYYYFICSPQGPLELNKLQAASGNRAYSGKLVRLVKNVAGRYALLGAGAFLSYQLTIDMLRHHDEANSRPAFFDHALGCLVVGTGAGALIFSHPF